MRRNDPARPDIGPGRPALVWGGKSINSIVPSLHIEPTAEPNQWLVTVMLPTEHNSYRWHEATRATDELLLLLEEFRADPEECFVENFNWTYNESKARPKQPDITLEDLGL